MALGNWDDLTAFKCSGIRREGALIMKDLCVFLLLENRVYIFFCLLLRQLGVLMHETNMQREMKCKNPFPKLGSLLLIMKHCVLAKLRRNTPSNSSGKKIFCRNQQNFAPQVNLFLITWFFQAAVNPWRKSWK